MKKFTISSILLLVAFASYAQYVPAKFKFSTLSAGVYKIDSCLNAASNPAAGFAPAYNATDGFSVFSGGQMGTTQTANIAAFKSALSIADMSSVGQGKVFVFKGFNSTAPEGMKATATIPGWLAFHFYSNTSFPVNQRVRVSFTFGMSTTAAGADGLLKLGITSGQIADITTGKLGEISFNSLDYNNTWFTVTTDVNATETNGVPIRIKLSIAGFKIDNAAIYMKDFSFTPVYDTSTKDTYEISNVTTLQHISTGVHDVKNVKFKTCIADGKIALRGLTVGDKVMVFSHTGARLSETIAQSESMSFSLAKGLYIVNVNGQSQKIVL